MNSSPSPTLTQRKPAYDDLKQTAVSDDERARIRLAGGSATPPELLYFLATDQSISVRAAVACNAATPAQADRCLTRDPDDRVRMVLARKLATLTPALAGDDQARLARHAWDNLGILVRDEAERVRALVADLVKDLPDAPRALILQLAQDASFDVSAPVLRLSPALTQEDLLGLLACAPAPHTAQSIARRANLSSAVCDAIATTADAPAIRCLLQNPTAAIREATLDALVARASEQVEWHEPLVRHPALSSANARLLSNIVTERLILVLAARTDLDAGVVSDLRRKLEHRASTPAKPASGGPGQSWLTPPAGAAAGGRLSENVIIDAVRAGDIERVATLLALAADVPATSVQRAARLRSAKAAVSLVWKAKLSMRVALPVQSCLCNLPPNAMLRASEDGGFPLSEDEMLWQIEFLTRAGP